MGANVQFIAFREAPDIARLAAIPGLTGYRLFKHIERPEWCLEGPNPDGDGITFYQPLDYAPKSEAAKTGAANAKAVAATIKSAGITAYGLDEKTVAAALALSVEIGIATLLIYSNDEGVDAGFVCEAGRVIYARLPTMTRDVVVVLNGAAQVEPPQTDEYDEGEPVLDQHQFATETANAFFGTSIRWRVTSDPTEFKAADYKCVAASGTRAPLHLPGDATKQALHAITVSDATPQEKLRRSIAIMDKHVAAAVDPRLITAPRAELDQVDFDRLACATYAGSRGRDDKSYAALADYLTELGGYLRTLKPKPDFRHNIDFHAESRRLMKEWTSLKVKLGA